MQAWKLGPALAGLPTAFLSLFTAKWCRYHQPALYTNGMTSSHVILKQISRQHAKQRQNFA